MKLVIVLPKLTCGGTERSAVELANFIVRQEGEVTIITMFRDDIFYEIDPKVRIVQPSIDSKKLGKYLYIVYLLFYLRINFKGIKPDVIFALGYILYTLFSSLFLLTGVIISFRSGPTRVRFPDNKVLNKLYILSHNLLRNRVNGIVAQTERARAVFVLRYECPIVVIPNFLRKLTDHKITRQKQILNIGHCSFEKGQHYLIKSFARLNAPDWKLVIVGDGPRRNYLQELAEIMGISNRVIFTGYQKDVDYFLSNSSIFAFTSIIEGYPNALIEAMATPLPVVSFDCEAGPSDIIIDGENGFLVETGDIDTFGQRLQELIDNPELRDRIQQKAFQIRYDNDIMKIAPRYLNFFQEIAAGNF